MQGIVPRGETPPSLVRARRNLIRIQPKIKPQSQLVVKPVYSEDPLEIFTKDAEKMSDSQLLKRIELLEDRRNDIQKEINKEWESLLPKDKRKLSIPDAISLYGIKNISVIVENVGCTRQTVYNYLRQNKIPTSNKERRELVFKGLMK